MWWAGWLLAVAGSVVGLVWSVTYWLFHEDRFEYDAGKRSKSLADLRASNLITRTKVVTIGTMPGTPLEERVGWRLAQVLGVPYLELSNVNIFFGSNDADDGNENGTKPEEDEREVTHRPIRNLARPKDWRKEADIKRRFPSRVGDMVRRFFSKNKYNGYVVEMILDRWEVYDPLLEEARDLVWLDVPLRQRLLQLMRRVIAVLLFRASRPMFSEDVQHREQDVKPGSKVEGSGWPYTAYWYRWSNLVCFWDENRSLLAKTISVHYKNLQTAPFLLDHNGQVECWHLRSPSQADAFLQAVRTEKERQQT